MADGWNATNSFRSGRLMKTSSRGIALIKEFEGLELKAYKDVAGVWTIGYGHTKGFRKGRFHPEYKITECEANDLLIADLQLFEDAINDAVIVNLNQNQFDALASFTFNVGIGGFRSSTALKRLNKRDLLGAAKALTWWDKARVNGRLRVVHGLVRRRNRERDLFLTPIKREFAQKPDREARPLFG